MDEKRLEQKATADQKIIFRLDRDFELISIPSELCMELGYESFEMLLYYAGTSLLFSLDTEDVPAFRLFVERAISGDAANPCYTRMRTRDGHSLWYLFNNCAAHQDGGQKIASCAAAVFQTIFLCGNICGKRKRAFDSSVSS